jgi:hypothetical protein
MQKMLFMMPLFFASNSFAAENAIDRWANAIGGRARVAPIKSIYREATISVSGYEGTIKAWHTVMEGIGKKSRWRHYRPLKRSTERPQPFSGAQHRHSKCPVLSSKERDQPLMRTGMRCSSSFFPNAGTVPSPSMAMTRSCSNRKAVSTGA